MQDQPNRENQERDKRHREAWQQLLRERPAQLIRERHDQFIREQIARIQHERVEWHTTLRQSFADLAPIDKLHERARLFVKHFIAEKCLQQSRGLDRPLFRKTLQQVKETCMKNLSVEEEAAFLACEARHVTRSVDLHLNPSLGREVDIDPAPHVMMMAFVDVESIIEDSQFATWWARFSEIGLPYDWKKPKTEKELFQTIKDLDALPAVTC